ncbi:MAG: DNA repair protein RecO [Deltaproteobacteria bacterium]|nr:DNA repair protein RecO [Deltaproteobacteria bacterium]
MRTKEFGESDLLVFFFTPDLGQLKGVAKGGRRSRKRFANSLDILSLVRLEYDMRRGGSLPLLQSGRLIHAFPRIRSDYTLLSLASYMVELTEVLFPIGVTDQRPFHLLKRALYALDRGQNEQGVLAAFEGRALSLGGYRISLESCSICGRRYTGQGHAVFLRDRGGIACMKCRSPSKGMPAMSPPAVKTLHILQSGSLDLSRDLDLPQEVIAEIRPVLRLHRDFRIGRPLKTAKHVD